MSKLNPKQREAVHYIDGPCLVLAGAGSGKTSVITQKIAYLIEKCGISSKHIAAVTFTNKAAREMKERVGKLIKSGQSRGLTISTFHNLGLAIIRQHLSTFGYREGFSIFDSEDARSLLKELLLNNSVDTDSDQVNRAQNFISRCKNDLILPDQALSKAENAEEQLFSLLYGRYNEALKVYNAVDFDDLIFLPVQFFITHADILSYWKKRIHYLLVDEYQDTNSSQYKLIHLLMADRASFTVVGDDDQSIYAWRGARPENLSVLQADFPNLHVIKLEQNYRSTQRILKVANHLIDHNPHEFTKSLWSDGAYGEPIRVIKANNEEAESERVATEIITQRLNRQCKFKDFAVLYRGNFQARLLELKLQHYQIPYSLSGGTSFFSRTEIKDLMAYLRIIVNPDDDNALLRIINTPKRQLGTSTLQKLSQYATNRSLSLFSASDEFGLEQSLSPASCKRLREFKQWLDHIIRQCEEADPIKALYEMLEDMDYLGWLHQQSSTPKAAEKRMENVHFLIKSIQKTLAHEEEDKLSETPKTTLKDAIAKLLLMDLLEQQEQEDDSDRVQLMTFHAAKGLEFPHVFLMGFEEELLPHRSSIEEDTIEEERRLTYVGITRAKRSLVITMAGKRKQYGEQSDTTVSRFLEELPSEDIELEGFGQSNPEANEIKGENTLSSLLDMFK